MSVELPEGSSERKRLARIGGVVVLVLVALAAGAKVASSFAHSSRHGVPVNDPAFWTDKCVQPNAIEPSGDFAATSQFLTSDYRDRSAKLLGGAVRVPTESFDNMEQNPLLDPRFKVFTDLHAYLNASFPLTTRTLELVNSYGLLYTIRGRSHKSPTVLMAHQDVVPVEPETVNKWTHPPFSGHYDGTRVWGRGALDTKSSLVAILEATESLLGQGWAPERDIVIAFGFDEELDGSRGAKHLAQAIRARYGAENSVFMIVDEGSGVSEQAGSTFASVSVAEKGYTDVFVTVRTPGGHSSLPPPHTGIGIASDLIVGLEKSWDVSRGALQGGDTIWQEFICLAAYGKDLSDEDRQRFVVGSELFDYLVNDPVLNTLIRTTQAVDIINGGVKINALPEQVTFVVNHRIDVHSSVAAETDFLQEEAAKIADAYNLGLVRNGETIKKPTKAGYIELANGQSLEPAPVSPSTIDSEAWRIISGTTRNVLETYFDIDRVFVSPALMGGNTDTVHYWGLSENIYRYGVSLPNAGANAHTVDEWINVDSHIATVAWYYELLQVV